MNTLTLTTNELLRGIQVAAKLIFSPPVLAGLFALLLVGLLITIIVILIRRDSLSLTPDKAKEAILAAEERAHAIVAEAAAEARRARLSIEKERTHALNEDHQEVERFLDAYRFHLDKTIKELSYGVEKEHLRVTSHFVEVLQGIEDRVSMNADEAKQSMDSFTSQSGTLFDRLAYQIENVETGIQHLATALEEAAADEAGKNALVLREEMQKIGVETAKSVVEVAKGLDQALKVNVEHEFATIKNELERYRDARMHMVDEKIMVLVEETAQIALQKKLSLQEHSDLVYRSLEEAKQRGVFV
jgi:hypothetical protein